MSTKNEIAFIKPLDFNSDYRSWRICIRAACSAKCIVVVLDSSELHHGGTYDTKTKFNVIQSHASNIIIAALPDTLLRVVIDVIGDPCKILAKLDKQCDSKTSASKLSKIPDLAGTRYTNHPQSLTKQVDKNGALPCPTKGSGQLN